MELYLLNFVIVMALAVTIAYLLFKTFELGKITKAQYNIIRGVLLCVGLIYLILVESGVNFYG